MLEHQMIVLANVSSDKQLFKKELIKSLKWLDPIDCTRLMEWIDIKYGDIYQDVIREVFADFAA